MLQNFQILVVSYPILPLHRLVLNFVNNSNDVISEAIVLFQKNNVAQLDETCIAWKVIKNCGLGWSHPFSYPLDVEIAASDSYGNMTPMYSASEGQKWSLVLNASGDELVLSDTPAANPIQIELQNDLEQGAIDARIYRDGKLLGIRNALVPAQKTVFQYRPIIMIGVIDNIEEGSIINPTVLSSHFTEVSLLGFTKADLVMTGGGIGPKAQPFQFHLFPKG